MRVVRRVHALVPAAACRRVYVRVGRRWSWTPDHLETPVAPWTMAMRRCGEEPLVGGTALAQCQSTRRQLSRRRRRPNVGAFWVSAAMTLLDKVLARPLEPGRVRVRQNKTRRWWRRRWLPGTRGRRSCHVDGIIEVCRVWCLGKVSTGCFTCRSCRESKRLGPWVG